MNEILQHISNIGIVPVIAIEDAGKAVDLARALSLGGLPAAEVTFRTAAGEEAIRRIASECPDVMVGAGTVTTRDQLDRALDAGAKFIVSPGFNPDIVRYGLSRGALMLPGTATPGEMEQAMALGLEVVKFFPAEQNGGVAKLKAVAGPYRNLMWMPTGGVNTKNLLDYLRFDQILACGGTWMVRKDLIEGERWDEITAICREAVKTMLGFSLDHVGIPCGSEPDAAATARAICAIFGFPFRAGADAEHAGPIECCKAPGARSHIAIGTYSVDRAIYHLGRQGVRFLDDTRKTDAKGKTTSICLDGDFGGFALHLVKR